jgi:DNA-directed RNA polymerase
MAAYNSSFDTRHLEKHGRQYRVGKDRDLYFTDLAAAVGAALEHAVNDATWKAKNPALYKSYIRRMQERPTTRRRREANMRRGYRTHIRDQEGIQPWDQDLRVAVGGAFLEAALRVTEIGIVDRPRAKKSAKGVVKRPEFVELNETVIDDLIEHVNADALVATVERAMVCEPLPWLAPRGGGFLRPHYVSHAGEDGCVNGGAKGNQGGGVIGSH